MPGVLYTIQRSGDLNMWTDETTHYGLGHDFATALRAVDGSEVPAPPGGGPPPNPVGSLRLVSVTLRPSAGAEGGTVVAWPSLHGIGPVAALIPENLDATWAAMALYARDFDGWMFFIRRTSLPANPPAADDPPHAGLDADMLASHHERSMTPNGWLLTGRDAGYRLHMPVLAEDSEEASDEEINLNLAMDNGSGPVESLSHPLALKAMKPRLVQVALHRVAFQKPGGALHPPDIELGAADLQTHLNAVFRPQLNTTFEVIDGPSFILDWDADGNGSFDFGTDGITLSGDQSVIANHGAVVKEANIKVFLMGAPYYLGGPGRAAAGVFTRINPDNQGTHNACWIHATNEINGHPSNNPRGADHLKSTIGHEIGHICVGPGHPGETIGGAAPLPGTDHRRRLMAGGKIVPLGGIRAGKLLVKAEWDAAEAWLEANIKDEEE